MRLLIPPCTLSIRVCVLIALSMTTAACSRGEPKALEARLGKSPNDYGRPGYGDERDARQRAGTPGSPEDFRKTNSDTIYFSSDSSDISAESRQSLAGQVRWLQQYQNHTITIEGHADERGTREYNIALGARRAAAVKSFLLAQGVNPARIRALSYGKERPVAYCNDISCWSQNRRAQTVLNGMALSRY